MIERTWSATDEPAVIVAKGGELLDYIREFAASPEWQAVTAHCSRHIQAGLNEFECGTGNDSEIRGALRAYRQVLQLPDMWKSAVQRDINHHRGSNNT